jgi:hypothetical protein
VRLTGQEKSVHQVVLVSQNFVERLDEMLVGLVSSLDDVVRKEAQNRRSRRENEEENDA